MRLLGLLVALSDRRTERGATATEYALLISGIALVLVGATVFLGERLSAAFTTLSSII